jgi:hypothetical protein
MEKTLLYRKQSEEYQGKRIRCIHMNDDPHPVPDGIEGTVIYVDDIGTIQVIWDNGSSLGLIQGVDEYKFI